MVDHKRDFLNIFSRFSAEGEIQTVKHLFDFDGTIVFSGEFDEEKLHSPSENRKITDQMKKLLEDQEDVSILTARSNPELVRDYLDSIDFPEIEIIALGNPGNKAKGDYIRKHYIDYDKVILYDDRKAYLDYAEEVMSDTEVTFMPMHIRDERRVQASSQYQRIYSGGEDLEYLEDDYGLDPYEIQDQAYALAKNNGINILSNKELFKMILDGGRVIAALFTASDMDEYEFDVVVDPEYRRQGLAKELVEDAVMDYEGVKEVYPEVKFNVDVVNPNMQKLLEGMGFSVVDKVGDHTIMTRGALEEGYEEIGNGSMPATEDTTIIAAKQVGILYHFTSPRNVESILSENKLKSAGSSVIDSNATPGISFTRTFDLSGTFGRARFTIDGDKLSQNHKIAPYNDFGSEDLYEKDKSSGEYAYMHKPGSDEMEEKVEGMELNNIRDFIIQIDIHRSFKDAETIAEGLKLDYPDIPINLVDKFEPHHRMQMAASAEEIAITLNKGIQETINAPEEKIETLELDTEPVTYEEIEQGVNRTLEQHKINDPDLLIFPWVKDGHCASCWHNESFKDMYEVGDAGMLRHELEERLKGLNDWCKKMLEKDFPEKESYSFENLFEDLI